MSCSKYNNLSELTSPTPKQSINS